MRSKLLIIASVLFFTTLFSVKAQRGYNEFENRDGIKVMYRWQRSVFFLRNSDAVLNLRMTNEHETAVNITYRVAFFEDGVLSYESERSQLCLRPGQSRRGGIAGLRFTLEDMKMDDVENPSFLWDFSVFDVDKVDGCN